MKTALHTSIAATALGVAFLASGRLIDAADVTVLFFSAGIVAWTVAQYRTAPRAIDLDFKRPVRLRIGPARGPGSPTATRAAA
ncbi:MAG TPA: hypothetical protein VEB66_04710 [Opitutaceae bacterium]|nr:hypothetical protein [Opitutaceae bacterium]